VAAAAATINQEQVPSYKHLDELLDEGRFCILNVFWQGTSKRCSWPLYCTLHLFCLTFFLEIGCFLLQNKLFITCNPYQWRRTGLCGILATLH